MARTRRDALEVVKTDISRQADGGFLAFWRGRAGLTQGEVQALTGIDFTALSRIETGKRALKGRLEGTLLSCYEEQALREPEAPPLGEQLSERRTRVAHQIGNARSVEGLKALLDYYSRREPYASSLQAPASNDLHDGIEVTESDASEALRHQIQENLDLAFLQASRLDPAQQAMYLVGLRNLIRSATRLGPTQLDDLEFVATESLLGLRD